MQVLQGKRKRSIWEDEDEDAWHADDLTQSRLRVLERQQRFDEYLRLAAVEGQHKSHGVMLAKLGRAEEAVKYALKKFRAPSEFLQLAQALQPKGFIAEALRIAEHGLSLRNPDEDLEWDLGVRSGKAELASWLRDAAMEQGQSELALRAARIAVVEAPHLQAYLKTKDLAGKKWKSVREELLSEIRKSKTSDKEGLADIFLHEKLFDEALDAVKNSWDRDLIGRVIDAAIEHRPARVIPICRKFSDDIMDNGRSEAYAEAARWLERMQAACQVADQIEEWEQHLHSLLGKHSKKWKLMPLLKALEC